MKVEEYLVQVIRKEKTGLVPSLLLLFLTVLAQIYRVIVYIRRRAYDWGLKKSKSLDCTVISVGNITVGGTGKTPTVKKIATDLEQAGYSSVILSRGYKGEFTEDIGVVSSGNKLLMSAQEAGDEPYLLAKFLNSIPVIVGAKRKKTGKYACARFNPDFIILDDGFQHWQVERDYDIVAIDAVHPFGEEKVLPGGLLREPLSSLKRADAVIITRADQVTEEQLETTKAKVKTINSDIKIISTKHQPTYLRDLISNQKQEMDLQKKRVMAVSGIGNPRSFEMTLDELGAELVKKVRYQDHHSYTENEINRLFTLAAVHNVDKIVTTEKDAVSINNDLIELNNVGIDVQALGIELEVLSAAEDWDYVLEEIKEVSR